MSIEMRRGVFTDLTLSGSGFATFEDGKQAFVPSSIVTKTQVQVGDLVDCRLAPNYQDRATDSCPWRCFFMTLPESDQDPTDEERAAESVSDPRELRPQLVEFFKEGGAWTVREVYEELYGPVGDSRLASAEDSRRYTELANQINGMARQGYLAVAKIHGPGSSRAWRAYFSMSREALIPLGSTEEEEANA